MKTVILAGGLGTRLSEETATKPKPMVEIGGMPILWHIMKSYASYGLKDFVICLGYQGGVIKSFFKDIELYSNNVTLSSQGGIEFHSKIDDDWRITLIDTGQNTQTGGRLKRIGEHLPDDEPFCMTYGDGLSDVNIQELIEFHKNSDKLATVTATRPSARFGALELEANNVTSFVEKPISESGWINGGFFVLEKPVLDYISDDLMPWEQAPMRDLAQQGHMQAYLHEGFWQPMDTLREKNVLEDLWLQNKAPWKTWD